ncbi:hypothetical protein [Marinirhabdus gelatinilytica]|uniref:Uncharacterized protein n=1 Tax=Marinirhabdus gelatinilytica TaxID=1703343 RepID=A0A370Q5A4_9FLAO|nr:hypothetical protein [Marinirhabdus gelatinilytica]RDK83524.1 hypothetical protein C8D94_10761 [Marinirhabdus gelatinilytica]
MKHFLFLLLLIPFVGFSQVGVGTITPSPRAALEVSSTSDGGTTYGGFIPPRVPTTTERDAINPGFSDYGMLVFVEATGCLQIWTGAAWADVTCITVATPEVWINEIHYDNIGLDSGEGFEIAGAAGTDLSDYEVVRYNGSNGDPYLATISLSGTLANDSNGIGFQEFLVATDGLQNGAPDGLALVRVSTGNVIQFLSYEGSFIGNSGPAIGMASEDIGVDESNTTTPVGTSMQLVGTGNEYVDFTWTTGNAETFDAINTGQVIN